MITVIYLPLPVSTNNLYLNVRNRGRVKSPKYRRWRDQAMLYLASQHPRPVRGRVSVAILVPRTIRGDCDNRIKPCLDLLVAAAVIDDDRFVDAVSIERADVVETTISITSVPPREVPTIDTSVSIGRAVDRVLAGIAKEAAE